MSKSAPLTGCLAMFHDKIDCEEAGIQDPKNRCAPCWVQSPGVSWNEQLARELVRRTTIMDATDAEDEEQQIEAGVAWLRDLWLERHQVS